MPIRFVFREGRFVFLPSFYSEGGKILVMLKREAVKNLMENTGMLAGDALADILETIRRWTFTVLTH